MAQPLIGLWHIYVELFLFVLLRWLCMSAQHLWWLSHSYLLDLGWGKWCIKDSLSPHYYQRVPPCPMAWLSEVVKLSISLFYYCGNKKTVCSMQTQFIKSQCTCHTSTRWSRSTALSCTMNIGAAGTKSYIINTNTIALIITCTPIQWARR